MKHLVKYFFCAIVALLLAGCTADYDTFSKSHYKTFNGISFDEQDGEPSVYADEHLVKVRLQAPPESLSTWDSVTVADYDISSLATLHLVDGKFKEFPSDSLELDSLANEVSYVKDKIHLGDKIRIPQSLKVYMMVVAENGDPSIWELNFTIPGVKAASSSSVAKSSSSVKESSSSGKATSSSSAKEETSASADSKSSSSARTSSDPSSAASSADSNSSNDSGEGNAVAPRILSMKIAGNDAMVDSVEENGQLVYWVHYDSLEFLSDLTALEVSDIELSEGASITGVENGGSYDLGTGVNVTVSNGYESLDYEIRAGYQYPNSDFKTWNSNKPSSWDNGNQTGIVSVTITSSTSMGEDYAVYMQTKTAPVVKTLASGNLFIGVMNPKGVAATSMLSYKDGNELIDFGMPFNARPRYMELDIQYEGKNDSCDVYLLLENRTSTKTCDNGSNMGSNVCRTSSDVNTLVASAWYRATTDDDTSDPDVVSISEPDPETGLRTLRMKLKYGEPDAASPIMNVGSEEGTVSTLYDGGLLNSKGIDNHLVTGDGTLPVTHIRAVFAASADGNHYSGVEGAVFIVDNFRLIY